MLTKVLLKNFKPFGETEQSIDLGKITIFIGPNGAGKSSVLQAMELLKQSRGSPNLRPGRFQFSDYSQLVNSGVTSKTIGIGFSGQAKQVSEGFEDTAFTYHATFGSSGNIVEQNGRIRAENSAWPDLPSQININGQYLYGDTQIDPSTIGGEKFGVTIGVGNQICVPFTVHGGSHQGKDDLKDFEKLSQSIRQLFDLFLDSVGRVFIVGAIRGFDQLDYELGNDAVESLNNDKDVVDTFHYRRKLEEKISQWLQSITGVRVSPHLAPNKRASLVTADGYNIYHEGFGTNQIIRPLLQIAIAPPDSVIAIEEAEIHLHPMAQMKLCDVLTKIAFEENKQIILTTHSEHMLTGFLNIVAERILKPEELSVYFFEKKKGEAKATKMNVDDKGALEGGLKGFAEASIEGLHRQLKALAKKHG